VRILQVCPKYYPSIGGIEEYIKNISERLAKEHEVCVFTCDPTCRLPKQEKINSVLVERFKSFSPSDAYHISFQMAKELKKAEFDIVHGHSYHALPLYFSRNARGKKFIVNTYYHGHGHTPVRSVFIKFYKPFGSKILKSASRIIAISNYEKELLRRDFAIKEDKLSVIPPGIDLSEFGNLERICKKSKTILFIGRLERYKGVQHIIQMLPLLDKDFHLQIVGKGPYKANLVTLIDKLGLNDSVKFYQDLTRQELLKMYVGAGVFVTLSQHETFSIVVAEALAAKTPCIVANTSALIEWIDNKNCFGINYPVDGHELAELITSVIGRKVKKEKLWDWDEVAQSILKLYKEQLN
jgi:glycosyltransferase involved in cell wall biosynthesis